MKAINNESVESIIFTSMCTFIRNLNIILNNVFDDYYEKYSFMFKDFLID